MKKENKKEPKKAAGKKKKQAAKKPAGKRKGKKPKRDFIRIGIIEVDERGKGLFTTFGLSEKNNPYELITTLNLSRMLLSRKKDIRPLEETFKLRKGLIDKKDDDTLLVIDGKSILQGLHTDETKTQTLLDASEEAHNSGDALNAFSIIMIAAKTIANQEFARKNVDASLVFPQVTIATTKEGEDLIKAISEGVTEGKLGELVKETVACANEPALNNDHLKRMTLLGEQLEMLIDLDAIWQTMQILTDAKERYRKEAEEAAKDDAKSLEQTMDVINRWQDTDFLRKSQEELILENLPYVSYTLPGSESENILLPAKFDPPRIVLQENVLKSLIITAIGSIPTLKKEE